MFADMAELKQILLLAAPVAGELAFPNNPHEEDTWTKPTSFC
ncbi:MAG TPA: hypothetical protein VKT52_08060 [Ktedonobacterales bacterium]|nr:hypothetical protein [Ktedonobacterales bacterium]